MIFGSDYSSSSVPPVDHIGKSSLSLVILQKWSLLGFDLCVLACSQHSIISYGKYNILISSGQWSVITVKQRQIFPWSILHRTFFGIFHINDISRHLRSVGFPPGWRRRGCCQRNLQPHSEWGGRNLSEVRDAWLAVCWYQRTDQYQNSPSQQHKSNFHSDLSKRSWTLDKLRLKLQSNGVTGGK